MHPEQQESTWVYEALAWLDLNRKRVIAAGVLVLAIIILGYVYAWMRGQASLRANQALLSLETGEAGGAQGEPVATPAEFLKVAGEHNSTHAAARALLLAAGQSFRDGKYAEAQTHFEQAGARDQSGLLAPIAALGAAASLDAQDKLDAAMTAYREVASRFPGEPAAARAQLALAGLHEGRGETEQALKIYETVAGSKTAGQAAMDGATKRDALLKLHPGLARTNAAPPLIAAPAVATNAPAPAGP